MVKKEIATEVEGERILLRKLRAGDAEDIYRQIKSRDVARWTLALPHPYPEDGAIKHIRQQQRLWRQKRAFSFAIVLKKSGKLIGGTGLQRVDFKHGCGELGYWLAKPYWNKGLATDACQLLLQFGFEELKLHRIYAMALEANKASCRVLEKCGFVREGCMREALIKHQQRQNLLSFGILSREQVR